jgi:ferredoxin
VTMKVVVDRSQCVGTGLCEVRASAVFAIDDDGRLSILDEDIRPDQLDAVRGAVTACPTQALSLIEG